MNIDQRLKRLTRQSKVLRQNCLRLHERSVRRRKQVAQLAADIGKLRRLSGSRERRLALKRKLQA